MTPTNYEAAWRALSDPLSWMHDSPRLKRYWGWNLADIANDLIDQAYPGLRAATPPASTSTASAYDRLERHLDEHYYAGARDDLRAVARTSTAIAARVIAREDECPGCDGAGDGGYGVPCSICGGTGRDAAAPKAASEDGATGLLRERIAKAAWNAMHPSGTSWEDWERQVAANGGFDGRATAYSIADATLAALAVSPTDATGAG